MEGDSHGGGRRSCTPTSAAAFATRSTTSAAQRFVSEYGIIGPCHLDSIREYLGPDEVHPDSPGWQMHTNMFEKKTKRPPQPSSATTPSRPG